MPSSSPHHPHHQANHAGHHHQNGRAASNAGQVAGHGRKSSTAADEYGRTVGDALQFLRDAERVLLCIALGRPGHTFMQVPPEHILTALAMSPRSDPLPCAYARQMKTLVIGHQDAIRKAEEQG